MMKKVAEDTWERRYYILSSQFQNGKTRNFDFDKNGIQ